MIFTGTTAAGETITYRDGKRYLWLLSYISTADPDVVLLALSQNRQFGRDADSRSSSSSA